MQKLKRWSTEQVRAPKSEEGDRNFEKLQPCSQVEITKFGFISYIGP